MSEAKLKVGIVGAGPIGGLGKRSTSHANAFRHCEDAELVAVADINPARLQQFGDEWEIAPEQRYNSDQAMYAGAKLDVVVVSTHNLHHHSPVIAAAEAGIKAILVEKPLAISVEWGRKMIEACDRHGSHLLVNHTRRFLPYYHHLKKMIDEGAIGDVKTIVKDDCRPLLHNGTHTVDNAFYFTSATPRLVSGYLNDEPVADPGGGGTIVCDGGVVIYINCVAERREYLGYTAISGSAGRINFYDNRGIWEYGPLVPSTEGYGTRYDFHPIPEMPATFETDNLFYWVARDTLDCLKEDRESVSSGREALKTLEAITAMHISHKTGAHVRLPLAEGLDNVEIRSTGK